MADRVFVTESCKIDPPEEFLDSDVGCEAEPNESVVFYVVSEKKRTPSNAGLCQKSKMCQNQQSSKIFSEVCTEPNADKAVGVVPTYSCIKTNDFGYAETVIEVEAAKTETVQRNTAFSKAQETTQAIGSEDMNLSSSKKNPLKSNAKVAEPEFCQNKRTERKKQHKGIYHNSEEEEFCSSSHAKNQRRRRYNGHHSARPPNACGDLYAIFYYYQYANYFARVAFQQQAYIRVLMQRLNNVTKTHRETQTDYVEDMPPN